MVALILNLIWFFFGGWALGLVWLLGAAILAITIIGLPWARAAWNIGLYSFWPFGREPVSRKELYGTEDIGTGPLGLVGNIIWLLVAGLWLAIGHLGVAIAYAVTIIGLPFAFAHLKLAAASLWPIGMTIVPKEVAEELRRERARRMVDGARRD